MNSALAATAGRIAGVTHVLPLRVYYEDTDAAGIVYYANYLRFIERARTDFLRLAGISQSGLWRDSGLAFAVRDCEIHYLSPARLDDEVEVHTRLTELGGATLHAEQTVRRGATDLVRSQVRIACVDRAGRPARLPRQLRNALKRFVLS
ncbi:MAG: tol-pal system-associated acyl-CoA thioesterase [Alphaproteobacteria bacterium]|nr:tol-pal system-associated acyl-CoA thioesterase [Alphaproteobacteria bacterium]